MAFDPAIAFERFDLPRPGFDALAAPALVRFKQVNPFHLAQAEEEEFLQLRVRRQHVLITDR